MPDTWIVSGLVRMSDGARSDCGTSLVTVQVFDWSCVSNKIANVLQFAPVIRCGAMEWKQRIAPLGYRRRGCSSEPRMCIFFFSFFLLFFLFCISRQLWICSLSGHPDGPIRIGSNYRLHPAAHRHAHCRTTHSERQGILVKLECGVLEGGCVR